MKLIMTGDVNLLNVMDPHVPFARVAEEFNASDFVFINLECCLYEPRGKKSGRNEGFYASPRIGGEALLHAGVRAVGLANNVNYGDEAIVSSVAKLDELGIAHTGAGATLAAAISPAVLERNGVRVGFLQRCSIYWPRNHEALEDAPGIAVLKGHTAYHVPQYEIHPPFNRPGIPPEIVTWVDRKHLSALQGEIADLRKNVDLLVASFHWGLDKDVLEYMREIAHAAIDSGADIVIGHGPHYYLPVEIYKEKPIFYGLGSFSFHTGHQDRVHGDWVGLLVRAVLGERGSLEEIAFQFVRHNERNETVLCRLQDEREAFEDMRNRSSGASLSQRGDEVIVGFRQSAAEQPLP